jgi:hypothetical protein
MTTCPFAATQSEAFMQPSDRWTRPAPPGNPAFINTHLLPPSSDLQTGKDSFPGGDTDHRPMAKHRSAVGHATDTLVPISPNSSTMLLAGGFGSGGGNGVVSHRAFDPMNPPMATYRKGRPTKFPMFVPAATQWFGNAQSTASTCTLCPVGRTPTLEKERSEPRKPSTKNRGTSAMTMMSTVTPAERNRPVAGKLPSKNGCVLPSRNVTTAIKSTIAMMAISGKLGANTIAPRFQP